MNYIPRRLACALIATPLLSIAPTPAMANANDDPAVLTKYLADDFDAADHTCPAPPATLDDRAFVELLLQTQLCRLAAERATAPTRWWLSDLFDRYAKQIRALVARTHKQVASTNEPLLQVKKFNDQVNHARQQFMNTVYQRLAATIHEKLMESGREQRTLEQTMDEISRRQKELAQARREATDKWYAFQEQWIRSQMQDEDAAPAEPDTSCSTTALVLGAIAGGIGRGRSGNFGLNTTAAGLEACNNR